jgi:hypothetical protein
MKYLLYYAAALSIFACNSNESQTGASTTKTDSAIVSKSDLSKIKWINGNWRGMDGTSLFMNSMK